jgi:tetratricopeptide (TPR) repeat protein
MQKPGGLTDDQFTQFKTGELAVAHSGLGLVYFRREQYDASAKELETATQNEATPDPTDYFILGADLENLSRYKEAVDAFNRCAQIPGNMQDSCKKYASDATQRAADAK